jgi:hypothetical protein
MGTFFTNSYTGSSKTWYKGSNYVYLQSQPGTVGVAFTTPNVITNDASSQVKVAFVTPNVITNDASPQLVITSYLTDTLTINDKLVLEQPMQTLNINTYTQGTAITFATQSPFTAVNGTVVDPDQVLFGFIIDNDPTQTYTFVYTNGTGDPTRTIVRDSAGYYHASIDTLAYNSGVWVYSFAGRSDVAVGLDSTKTEVRVEAQCVVQAPAFSFPS